MKKKIEIEIPDKFPGVKPEEINERFDHRKEAAERRALALTNAILRRTKKPLVSKEALKMEGKSVNVSVDLTQKQIDALPVGLKKMLI